MIIPDNKNTTQTFTSTKPSTSILLAVLCFFLWGLFPMYFKLFKETSPWEVASMRIASTFAVLLFYHLYTGKLISLLRYVKNIQTLFLIGITAIFLLINWVSYIFAISSNQVLEASLGYFISPIITVTIGLLFLKEERNTPKILAIVLCVIAVVTKGLYEQSFSIYSLLIGVSFSTYGVLKKYIPFPVASTYLIEMSFLFLPAIGLLIYQYMQSDLVFISSLSNADPFALLFPGLGIITVIPGLLFSFSVRKVDLSIIGFLQYLTPFLIFLLAIFVYGENINIVNTLMFVLIWIAIGLVTYKEVTQLNSKRKIVPPLN